MTHPALAPYLLEQITVICSSDPSVTLDKVLNQFIILTAAGVVGAGTEYSEHIRRAFKNYKRQFETLLEDAELTLTSTAEQLYSYLQR